MFFFYNFKKNKIALLGRPIIKIFKLKSFASEIDKVVASAG